ncbi:MAG: type IX secretion system membrane protein PorP/SprF [Bacteroidetes bacterium]|nr:type IX secretion system membrane protein PorP/SprF [Bacteroidota bacterium]
MRKIINTLFLFFATCLPIVIGTYCFAQTYQITQYYAAPTFINPAFAGSGVCARLTTNYRVQWPSIPGAFSTYLFSFDHSIVKKNSGIGFLFVNDRAGAGNLRTTGFNAQYSYQLKLSRKWAFNAGFEAGFTQRNYDFNKYIFGDQIAFGTSTSVTQPAHDKVQYPDLSAGMLLYSEKIWIGFSGRHLNMPNQGLTSNESRLPILYSVHGGWVFRVSHKEEVGRAFTKQTITPAFNYRFEKKFVQLDIGCYYNYHLFVIGVWYRGLPVVKTYKQPAYKNNDALAILAGIVFNQVKFAYSYDLTVSRLAGSTAGAHEISISYQFCDPTNKRWKAVVPCAKF